MEPSLTFTRVLAQRKRVLWKTKHCVVEQIILPLTIRFFCQSEMSPAYFFKASRICVGYVDTLPVFVCFDFEEQDVLKLFGIKDTDWKWKDGQK